MAGGQTCRASPTGALVVSGGRPGLDKLKKPKTKKVKRDGTVPKRGWGGGIKGLRPTRRTVWGRGAEAKGG